MTALKESECKVGMNVIDGYWGPVDANNQWFEERYSYSPYISEFWNTITSAAFVFVGIYGLYLSHKFGIRLRFAWLYVILIVTGCGSIMFHLTSRWWAEVLDELPMIFLVYQFIFLTKGNFPEFSSVIWHTVNTVFAGTILVTYLYFHIYPVFVHGFSAYIVFFSMVPFLDKGSTYKYEIWNCYFWGIVLGRVVWESEQNFGIWQLHSCWHFAGCYAVWNGIKYTIIYHCEHYGVDYVCSKPPKGGLETVLRAFNLEPKSKSCGDENSVKISSTARKNYI